MTLSDNELRKKLLAIELPAYRICESVNHVGRYAMLHPKGINELMALIQQQVQEARIDELVWLQAKDMKLYRNRTLSGRIAELSKEQSHE